MKIWRQPQIRWFKVLRPHWACEEEIWNATKNTHPINHRLNKPRRCLSNSDCRSSVLLLTAKINALVSVISILWSASNFWTTASYGLHPTSELTSSSPYDLSPTFPIRPQPFPTLWSWQQAHQELQAHRQYRIRTTIYTKKHWSGKNPSGYWHFLS